MINKDYTKTGACVAGGWHRSSPSLGPHRPGLLITWSAETFPPTPGQPLSKNHLQHADGQLHPARRDCDEHRAPPDTLGKALERGPTGARNLLLTGPLIAAALRERPAGQTGVPDMKSPFECRRYAEECRALANGLSADRRREVLAMADIWEGLARDSENAWKRKFAQQATQEAEQSPLPARPR
jgi:hypothetical protein